MRALTTGIAAIAATAAAFSIEACGCQKAAPGGPGSSDTPPHTVIAGRTLHQPPPLTATNDADAQRAVGAFIDWAGDSFVSEKEDARAVIASARDNPAIIKAMTDQAESARTADHSRALLILSILGETRSQYAFGYLRDLVRRPLPTDGHVVDGEMVEQTALATLQAKAVEGLAYAGTSAGDEEVLHAVAENPSRIVRAAAINAYKFNHQDSEQTRSVLLRYVRKDEVQFIDRPAHNGQSAAVFNRNLDEYLRRHPEAAAPPPEHGEGRPRQGADGKPASAPPPM